MPQSFEPTLQSPLSSFERSASDAERMLRLASGLADVRVQKMRRDQKETLGRALKVRKAEWEDLERAEGSEAWVILKPNANLRRDMFGEDALTPLTRQSVVVMAAAVETFVGDCVVATLRRQLDGSTMPENAVQLLEKRVRRDAGAHPNKVQELFRRVGIDDVLAAASAIAGFEVKQHLAHLVEMRNHVAHGSVPSALTCDAALSLLDGTRSVVASLDAALAAAS